MIYIVCTDCSTAVRVSGDHDEIQHLFGEGNEEWYPDKYPCPNAQCSKKAKQVDSIASAALKMLHIYDLTPHEAYKAFHGLGLPDEQDCGPTAVNKVLTEGEVERVDAKLVKGSNRSVIYSIRMKDGTILFLGSSPFGATVYRIAKPKSAVEQFDEEG